MDTCASCSQVASFVCSCESICLCSDWILAHMEAAPDDTHFIAPYGRRNRRPNFQAARKMIDNLEIMDQFIENEEQSLERMKQYREDLPKVFEKLHYDFKTQLANLYEFLNEKSLEVEYKIQHNLSTCYTAAFAEDEVPQVTEGLKFDIDSSLDPIIEEFVTKLQKQLAVTHTMMQPSKSESNESRPYVWSNNHKHEDFILSNGNKTATRTSCGQSQIQMYRPMDHGRNTWTVKVEKASGDDYIGVCTHTDRFDQSMGSSSFNFWAFRFYSSAQKRSKLIEAAYGRVAKSGDVITVDLEFNNGKGVLSFSVNDQDYGIAFEGLKPPLYPFVSCSGSDKFTIID